MLNSITASGLTLESLLICSGVAILAGLVIALIHSRTETHSKSLAVTLVILPVLVQSVIMMVNGNLGTGVAILGAFSLVRFRSIPGTSREIVSVFFAMSVGLATGTGFIWFALLLTAIVSALLLSLHRLPLFNDQRANETLKITMPEDTDHTAAFQSVFKKHGVQAKLEQIKTKNMGSLFELTYDVQLPADINRKQLLDDLRVRNNNLAIALFESRLERGL
jgi:uncharacterized membrane protein YhiD involved in acid resistance